MSATDFHRIQRLEADPNHLTEVESSLITRSYSPPAPGDEPDVSGSFTTHASDEEWDDPIWFGSVRTPLIPASLLPGWLGNYVEAVAKFTQTPPGMAALVGLSVAACCVQRKFEVAPRPDGTYVEPLSIWTMSVMPPASRKTAVMRMLRKPLTEWEETRARGLEREIAENSAAREIAQKRIAHLRDMASKAEDLGERQSAAHAMAELEVHMPKEVFAPRLWTGDVTPEKLQDLLARHGRLAVLSDEGGIFEVMAGLYHEGKACIDVFLQAHAAEDTRTDRISREAHLRRPALSFGLTVQPEVIRQLAEGNKKSFRGRGVLARFLYCLPEPNIGRRDFAQHDPIPSEIEYAYQQGIAGLLAMPSMVDDAGIELPTRLTLGKEALACWLAFGQGVEERQGEGGEFAAIQDWTGKLPGAALRIAGLFHLIDGGPGLLISRKTIEAALDLCHLLIPHASSIFGQIHNDPGIEDAKFLLPWVLKQGPTFKKSDCLRAYHHRFSRVERLEAALDVLVSRNVIIGSHQLPTRKPTTFYEVNPKAAKEVQSGLA